MLCTCIYKTLSFYRDVKEGGGSGPNVIMTLSVAKSVWRCSLKATTSQTAEISPVTPSGGSKGVSGVSTETPFEISETS